MRSNFLGRLVLRRVRPNSLEKASLSCREGTCFAQIPRGEVQLSRQAGSVEDEVQLTPGTCFPQVARGEVQLSRQAGSG